MVGISACKVGPPAFPTTYDGLHESCGVNEPGVLRDRSHRAWDTDCVPGWWQVTQLCHVLYNLMHSI